MAVTYAETFGPGAAGWGMIHLQHDGTTTEGAGYPMALLFSTLYWNKKLKIAVLTLLTFAALC